MSAPVIIKLAARRGVGPMMIHVTLENMSVSGGHEEYLGVNSLNGVRQTKIRIIARPQATNPADDLQNACEQDGGNDPPHAIHVALCNMNSYIQCKSQMPQDRRNELTSGETEHDKKSKANAPRRYVSIGNGFGIDFRSCGQRR